MASKPAIRFVLALARLQIRSLPLITLAGIVACISPDSQQIAAQSTGGGVTKERITPAGPGDFTGEWEAMSDDGTTIDRAQIEIQDGQIRGVARSFERGFFSGRITMTSEASFTATPTDGALSLSISNPETNETISGRAYKRGDYLILSVGDFQTAYARPGVSLVASSKGSNDAEELARSVAGKIYESRTSASGRGAFVGGRTRLALCSDGSAAFDKSDVATTGGDGAVDMGDAISRRGQWSVVLYAGAPAIRAQWEGTGTSYSLTRYFRVEPYDDGSGARVDGVNLGAGGSC